MGINGILQAKDGMLVDKDGREVILTGVGFGNWLLPEGYMWRFRGERADRPRRIETVIRELAGTEYALSFWQKFRDWYITEDDIRKIAELGYNSVRIPFCAAVLMAEEPGVCFLQEGFDLLDRCVRWCEKYGLYVMLDMHGAPGGQTGANIDNCVDNIPRLFTDRHCWQNALALWRRLAEIYKDDPVIGGYDLLNEPVADEHYEKFLAPLCDFYNDCIRVIREVDTKHAVSIEGALWATDTAVFDKVYDPNMIIHFHRYWCETDISVLEPYIKLRDKLKMPLWLGETGENTKEWYRALLPLAYENGISWNFWPWKRMGNKSGVTCEIIAPEGWKLITGYADGGPHPGYEKAQAILDSYLENIKLNHVKFDQETVDAMMGRSIDLVQPV